MSSYSSSPPFPSVWTLQRTPDLHRLTVWCSPDCGALLRVPLLHGGLHHHQHPPQLRSLQLGHGGLLVAGAHQRAAAVLHGLRHVVAGLPRKPVRPPVIPSSKGSLVSLVRSVTQGWDTMDRLCQGFNSRLGAGVEGCHDLVTRRVPPDPEGGAGGGQEAGQHHRGPHHLHLSCVLDKGGNWTSNCDVYNVSWDVDCDIPGHSARPTLHSIPWSMN